EPGIVPRVGGRVADDAVRVWLVRVAGQFAGERVALPPRAGLADHPELVLGPVADTGEVPGPVALGRARGEPRRVIHPPAVECPAGVDRLRPGCPEAERAAVRGGVRPHWGARSDVV